MPWTISTGGLNASVALGAYIPSLSTSSCRSVLVSGNVAVTSPVIYQRAGVSFWGPLRA